MAWIRRAIDGPFNSFLCILLWAVPECCGAIIRGHEGGSLILPCRSLDKVGVWTKANWTILGVFNTINIPESPWKGVVSVAGSVNLRIQALEPARDNGEFVCTTDIGKQIVTVQVDRRPTPGQTRVQKNGKNRPFIPPNRDSDWSLPPDQEPDGSGSATSPLAAQPTASTSPPAGQPTASPSPATENSTPISPTTTTSVLIVLGVTLGVFCVTVLFVIGVVRCCYRHRSHRNRQKMKRPAPDTALHEGRQVHGETVGPCYTHLWTDRDGYLAPVRSPGTMAPTYTQLHTGVYLTPVSPATRNAGAPREAGTRRPTSSRVYEEIIN
ncbi:uncharacterized protein LOC135462118 [Liolophura sinensis]|uniref:uncharacterized protein LOC135462118 n=1 Tax=Liolophura sinensis TaxID=3198878 RepID=UPI0031592897